MRELRDLVAAIDATERSGEQMALATVVHIEGSTYRRPGARMLVPASGIRVGTVSGGCLEDDVSRIARQVIDEGRPRMARFDLTADDDALWGYGLGCNGLIDLFLEPTDGVMELRRVLRSVIDDGRSGSLVTVLHSDRPDVAAGARLFVPDDGEPEGSLASAGEPAVALAAQARARRRTLVDEVGTEGETVRVFAEPLETPIRLVIMGAGDDAAPLARYADELGWSVLVTDPRRALLSPERLPAVELVAEPAAEALKGRQLQPRTAAVVMSHNFLRDVEYLRALIGAPQVFYIGMLGPRQRTDRVLDFLAEEGVHPAPDDVAKLHAPAGLDIGAEGPQQIAWSILAEILAVANGRSGAPLRLRSAPIHEDGGSSDAATQLAARPPDRATREPLSPTRPTR